MSQFTATAATKSLKLVVVVKVSLVALNRVLRCIVLASAFSDFPLVGS